MEPKLITLVINGRKHQLAVKPNWTLLRVLREHLGYVEVKNGCEKGDCGACTVLLNDVPVNSCLILAYQADGAEVTTVSGLGSVNHPHPIQEAFADAGAVQCGYCTPGLLLVTKALLDRNSSPTESEIREAISGNLCRCTGYGLIVQAVMDAADRINRGGEM